MMTIKVTQDDENKFTIEWDENDPQESIFNTWKEKDFINAIEDYLKTFKKPGEADYYDKKIGESIEAMQEELQNINTEINHLSEATKTDWQDFWGEK